VSINGNGDQPPDTDPGGHEPPQPPIDLLERLIRRVLREEIALLRVDLANHQLEEFAHHERTAFELAAVKGQLASHLLEHAETERPGSS
jgi:hypothetical protein